MFEADRSLGAHRWPVVRLVAGSKTEVVLLSSRFFALTTHWNKCTVPCAGTQCELCPLLPQRGLFYLAVVCAGSVRMLELGAVSSSNLEQHCKLLHGGLRPGLVIELSRRTGKSPVYGEGVRFQEGVEEVTLLDLASHVMALYKFPPPNPGASIELYERRCCHIARSRNSMLAAALLANTQNRRVEGRV